MSYVGLGELQTISAEACRGKEIIRKANKAFSTAERYNAQKTWALISEFMLPSQNRGWFWDVSKGIRRDRRVFDSTAQQANRDLASAMQSTITNPTMKWMKFQYKDDKINQDPEATKWLDDATEVIFDHLSESNFDMQMNKFYLAICSLGHGILFHGNDFIFDAWHLSETAYVENDKGEVDTVFRKFKMTLKALHDKFGDKIGEDLCARLEKEPLVDQELYHVIHPNCKEKIKKGMDGLAPPENRAFQEAYVLQKGAIILQEGGYYELPVYVARWSCLPAETYGFGPGNIALADVRTLNKIKEESLRAMAKAINPTIVTTKQNMVSGDFRPGGMTVVRDIEGFKEFITQSRFSDVKVEVNDLQSMIKGCFYIDKLLLPPRTETGEMTAYEVSQRLEQMQQILGPVLSRLDVELLQPLVMRCFKELLRDNKIKPMPANVAQMMKGTSIDFTITFVNSLARAQHMAELRNVQQMLQEVGGMAQMNPQVLDNIDFDALVQYTAKIRDVPKGLLVSAEKVQQIRAQRQKQQQAQQMAAMAEQAGNAAHSFAKAGQASRPQQGGGNGK